MEVLQVVKIIRVENDTKAAARLRVEVRIYVLKRIGVPSMEKNKRALWLPR
jgi:hypothetical protein